MNTSRTQLFNIFDLKWNEDICKWFGIDPENLPEVADSNSCFGYTDCEGFFDEPVLIHSVIGDSYAALFGQNCRQLGMTKCTYGIDSSIMMNIGEKPSLSRHNVVTSIAWGLDGNIEYETTGWENWTDDVSLNHYSKGACFQWLFDCVDGIKLDERENHFIIESHPIF